MGRLLIILIAICAWGHTSRAQINLLHNPSFEDHWRCPQYIDLVKYANYWTSINDTVVSDIDTVGIPPGSYFCLPEYCNTCSASPFVRVPSSFYFSKSPHFGNGMMQVEMYYNERDSSFPEKRDYLQGRLKSQLIPGNQYCVSFYTSLTGGSAYAINKIGAYFDDATIDTATACGFVQSMYTPQIFETAIISDTANWTKVQGTFTATGTEKFITIGNFFEADAIDSFRLHFPRAISMGNDFYSLYLIDDVSVIKVGTVAYAGNDTTIDIGDTVWIGITNLFTEALKS